MAAQIFGQRLHHDVGAKIDRAQQIRRGDGVVHDQRHTVRMRDLRDLFDIGDIAQRIADGLDEHRLGPLVNELFERIRVTVVGEAGLDAELRQRVREKIVGAAIKGARRHDVVAGLGNGLDRVGHRRLAGGQRQCGNAAFQRRNALFQHIGGRVHDAGVDIARRFQIEKIGAMLGAVEGVGHGLVDRHRDRARGRIGRITGVNGEGFGFPVGVAHDGILRRRGRPSCRAVMSGVDTGWYQLMHIRA